MLCKNCPHLKSRLVGDITAVYWCGLVGSGYNHTSIGVQPWIEKPHPKCPLRGDKNNAKRLPTDPPK